MTVYRQYYVVYRLVAGYYAGRMYKTVRGTQWKKVAFMVIIQKNFKKKKILWLSYVVILNFLDCCIVSINCRWCLFSLKYIHMG